jgi:quinol monooxygenase YgiN
VVSQALSTALSERVARRERRRYWLAGPRKAPPTRELIMLTVGLVARLKPKPGKEQELRTLLKGAENLARAEAKTVVWYAFETPDGQSWIFDAFEDERGRKAHLEGPIAKALMGVKDTLLAEPPDIQPVSVIASK